MKSFSGGILCVLAQAAGSATPAAAVQMAVGHLAVARHVLVSRAWSRPTPQGLSTGVVYLTLTNPDAAPDQLIGASTPAAAAMALHRTTKVDGVASMIPVASLTLPPGGSVTLTPGGYHFMLTGLKSGLSAGSSFPATLRFAHAGAVRIQVMVRATAPEPSMAGMKMP